MKPRVKYADVFGLNLDALKDGDPLLLNGVPVQYAGHHYDLSIWLRVNRKVRFFRQRDVMPCLRAATLCGSSGPIGEEPAAHQPTEPK